MKVHELSQYGMPLNGLPKDALKKQQRVFGRIPFFIRMFFEQRRLKMAEWSR